MADRIGISWHMDMTSCLERLYPLCGKSTITLPGMHLVIGGHAIGYILTGSSVI